MWQAEGAYGRRPSTTMVHLPDYTRLIEELPDTDICVGDSLRPEQLKVARKLNGSTRRLRCN
jgi:hypothetical protein